MLMQVVCNNLDSIAGMLYGIGAVARHIGASGE